MGIATNRALCTSYTIYVAVHGIQMFYRKAEGSGFKTWADTCFPNSRRYKLSEADVP
jgi:hypothetical protein